MAPKNSWLMSLTPDIREKVFVVMREIRATADYHAMKFRELQPPYGTIRLGGAHIDEFLKSAVLYDILMCINQGYILDIAENSARALGRNIVSKWNAGKEYQVKRWEDSALALIKSSVQRIRCAASVK